MRLNRIKKYYGKKYLSKIVSKIMIITIQNLSQKEISSDQHNLFWFFAPIVVQKQ